MTAAIAADKALARRLYQELFGRGNASVADEIMAANCVSHGPGIAPRFGTDAIKRQVAILRAAAPDLGVALEDHVAEGDRVASRWRAEGTHVGALAMGSGAPLPPTGRRFEFVELRIDRIEGDRVVEAWFVPDRLGLLQQLGVLPAP